MSVHIFSALTRLAFIVVTTVKKWSSWRFDLQRYIYIFWYVMIIIAGFPSKQVAAMVACESSMSLSTRLISPPPQDVPGLPETDQPQFKRWRSIVDSVFKSKRKIDALASSQKISLMVSFEGLRRWFSEEETWPFYTGRYTASQDGTSHWWLYSDCSS